MRLYWSLLSWWHSSFPLHGWCISVVDCADHDECVDEWCHYCFPIYMALSFLEPCDCATRSSICLWRIQEIAFKHEFSDDRYFGRNAWKNFSRSYQATKEKRFTTPKKQMYASMCFWHKCSHNNSISHHENILRQFILDSRPWHRTMEYLCTYFAFFVLTTIESNLYLQHKTPRFKPWIILDLHNIYFGLILKNPTLLIFSTVYMQRVGLCLIFGIDKLYHKIRCNSTFMSYRYYVSKNEKYEVFLPWPRINV